MQRVTPQVSTAVELGIAREVKEVARLWSEMMLGATYHRKNCVDFQLIEGHIANGSTEAVIAVQRNEHVPSKGVGSALATVAAGKTVAPVAKEARKGKLPKCKTCKRFHPGECWKCPLCEQYGHNLERGRDQCAEALEWHAKSKRNEAGDAKCVAASAASEVVAVASQVGGRATVPGPGKW